MLTLVDNKDEQSDSKIFHIRLTDYELVFLQELIHSCKQSKVDYSDPDEAIDASIVESLNHKLNWGTNKI